MLPAPGSESLPLNRSLLLLGLALLLPFTAGCARIAYEREKPIAPHHTSFKPGTNDYGDVMLALGPPHRLSATPAGFAFLYEHISVEEKQLGVSFEKLFGAIGLGPSVQGGYNLGSIIRLLYAWAEADIETLMLEFDHEGALRTARYEQASSDLGSTIGISFVFAAERKLGLQDYEIEPAPLNWGGRLTDRMRVQLYRAQDLTTGQAGLARRPGNQSVGQNVNIPQQDLKKRREKIEDRR